MRDLFTLPRPSSAHPSSARPLSSRPASPRPERRSPPGFVNPDQWIAHVFSSKAAAQGGVVRRKTRDVERIVGWDLFRLALRRRGYRAVVNGGQVVIFCNRDPVKVVD